MEINVAVIYRYHRNVIANLFGRRRNFSVIFRYWYKFQVNIISLLILKLI